MANKTVIHLYVDKTIADTFQRAYPQSRSRFVENAMKLALSSQKEFDKIFFDVLYSERHEG